MDAVERLAILEDAERQHPVVELPDPDQARLTLEEARESPLTPPVVIEDHLYQDVRVLAAPGGAGKTTLVLCEAACVALGYPFFGHKALTPGPTLFVTAEDPRGRLAARLWRVARELTDDEAEQRKVIESLLIVDLVGADARLVEARNGQIVVSGLADRIVERYTDAGIVHVIFDPLASFGASEEAINSNAQALIVAARRISRGLGCAVTLVHHTGQEAARAKIVDAYAARGGSALSDGARMVHILVPYARDGEVKDVPAEVLAEAERETKAGGRPQILRLVRPKNTYGPAQEDLWLIRSGYQFWRIQILKRSPEDQRKADEDQVLRYLEAQVKARVYHSRKSLEDHAEDLRLPRARLRRALSSLLAKGLVVDADLPQELRQGARKTFLCPVSNLAKNPSTNGEIEKNGDQSRHLASGFNISPPYREKIGGDIAAADISPVPSSRQQQTARFGEIGEVGPNSDDDEVVEGSL